MVMQRDTAVSGGDTIALWLWNGDDDGGGETEYARVAGYAMDPNATTEDGRLSFSVTAEGSSTEFLRLDGQSDTTTIYSGHLLYDDTFWDDFVVPVVSVKVPAAAAPDWQAFPAGSNTYTYCYPDGSDTELFVSHQMPHRWKYGSDYDLHIHWAADTDTGGTVTARMVVDYTIADIGDTFGASSQSATGITINDDEQNIHQMDGILDPISGTGLTLSHVGLFRIWRDGDGTGGTDDYTGDLCLLSVDFHYQIDKPGSSNETDDN